MYLLSQQAPNFQPSRSEFTPLHFLQVKVSALWSVRYMTPAINSLPARLLEFKPIRHCRSTSKYYEAHMTTSYFNQPTVHTAHRPSSMQSVILQACEPFHNVNRPESEPGAATCRISLQLCILRWNSRLNWCEGEIVSSQSFNYTKHG
jgi:hypothetical protein